MGSYRGSRVLRDGGPLIFLTPLFCGWGNERIDLSPDPLRRIRYAGAGSSRVGDSIDLRVALKGLYDRMKLLPS